jgi:hypothetical protein
MAVVLDGNNLTTTGVINSATAKNSTSGTSIDFTGIPVGTERITVIFNGVSTSGTSNPQVQIGSGSVTTSGYVAASRETTVTTASVGSYTSGFAIASAAATNFLYGTLSLTLLSANTWVSSHSIGMIQGATGYAIVGGGTVTLSGALDRVRITTVNGTDTFDAGSINILYE